MKYNLHDDVEPMVVSDSTVAYATTATPTYHVERNFAPSATSELPTEYVRMALECALADERNGRLIPNDKVLDVVHILPRKSRQVNSDYCVGYTAESFALEGADTSILGAQ